MKRVSPGSLASSVEQLVGVGPALRTKLEKLGIVHISDLLFHLPIRYQDRTRSVALNHIRPGDECLVTGEIQGNKVSYGRSRSLLVDIADGRGLLTLRFFHFSKSQQQQLHIGAYVRCFGEVRFGPKGYEMVHPEYRVFAREPPEVAPDLTPVYRTTEGLGQVRLRTLCQQACEKLTKDKGTFRNADAFLQLHAPAVDITSQALEALQEELAFEELTAYYLIMKSRNIARKRSHTYALRRAQGLGRLLLKHLDFELTQAQKRVTTEVLEDLEKTVPMLRLLQGDVGSGKTIVAAFAAIRAAEHQMQTAVLAPTEILAEQHYRNFSEWLSPLGIEVVLLTGGQKTKEKRTTLDRIVRGEALVAIGTHALFQEQVHFAKLNLVIIDEQHRFGVHQRMALREKGESPHQLVMTATPIPRTLTMALYADMDVSIIDELPKNRQPITTRVMSDQRRSELIQHLAKSAPSEQTYWVCTQIDAGVENDIRNVEETFEQLQRSLPDLTVGLIHGRLSAIEKATVMAEFKAGVIQLLVATTVIEVGVDVPNATLIVIENADRLGLAQIHQLRGRVGRGQHASQCVLLYAGTLSQIGRARLAVLRDTTNGFVIAEEDLKLRGPGDLLGARQTGERQFRIADLQRHHHLFARIIPLATKMLQDDPIGVATLIAAWSPGDADLIEV